MIEKRRKEVSAAEFVAEECIAVRLRLLTRAVTRLYNNALRPHGLTVKPDECSGCRLPNGGGETSGHLPCSATGKVNAEPRCGTDARSGLARKYAGTGRSHHPPEGNASGREVSRKDDPRLEECSAPSEGFAAKTRDRESAESGRDDPVGRVADHGVNLLWNLCCTYNV
jgi:hypothetical protein